MKHCLSFRTKLSTRVVAFTTDASIDFSLAHSAPELSTVQKAFLCNQSKERIHHIVNIKQVHGHRVIVAKKDHARIPSADALITDQPGVVLAVRTADCLPIFVVDARRQAIGLIHAGWRSTHQNIVAMTIQAMQQRFKINVADLKIVLGPGLRRCCYEVGREFQRFFPDSVIAKGKKLFFDSVKENRKLLIQTGVRQEQIFDCGHCTFCEKNFFSYRRQGQDAGRMLSILMLKADQER